MPEYKSFKTDRLLLEPTNNDDANFLLKLLNTPSWLEFIGDRNVKSLDDAIEYVKNRIAPQYKSVGYGSYTIIRKSDNLKIGLCGLYKRDGLDDVDIGFALLPEHEGNGYAFESSERILRAAFEDFNLKTIVAITNKNNKSSQKLLEKLGLKHSGVTTLPNETKEVLVYRIEKNHLQKNMINENINNLTSLWEKASIPFSEFEEFPSFKYSEVHNSEWPNRLWFDHDINKESVFKAKELLLSCKSPLVIPYWDIHNSQSYKLLEDNDFKLKFEQAAMFMKLEKSFELENTLSMKLITNDKDAQTWENIYPHAFGYKISKEIIKHSQGKIQFYLALHNDEAIGTGILFTENNISGIHGVGVVPSVRRKGFAEEIMKFLINESILVGSEYSTLQASTMGKGIYLRLGYEEQFLIKNYIL